MQPQFEMTKHPAVYTQCDMIINEDVTECITMYWDAADAAVATKKANPFLGEGLQH